MIAASKRDSDLAFVGRTLKERKLDARPLPGFHAAADYWQETTRWKRVIERYSWGAVLFVADRERREAATLVVMGDFDPAKGTAEGKPLPVPWYAEMATALSRESAADRPIIDIPDCLGYHEGDHVCDGGANLATGQAEPPCAWRDRCIPFQLHCADRNQLPGEILKGKSPEEVVQITARLRESRASPLAVAAETISPGTKAQKPSSHEVTERTQEKRQAKRKPGSILLIPKLELVKPLARLRNDVASELQLISERTGHAVLWLENLPMDEDQAEPGTLLIRDRTSTSLYIAVTLRLPWPKKRPLFVYRLKPRLQMLDIQLPFEADHPKLAGLPPGTVSSWKDTGPFRAAIKHFTVGEAKIDLVRALMIDIISDAEADLR